MNSAIQSEGVFFIFGTFTLVATFFVKFWMKETKGLTDKEKKLLYFVEEKTEEKEIVRD